MFWNMDLNNAQNVHLFINKHILDCKFESKIPHDFIDSYKSSMTHTQAYMLNGICTLWHKDKWELSRLYLKKQTCNV